MAETVGNISLPISTENEQGRERKSPTANSSEARSSDGVSGLGSSPVVKQDVNEERSKLLGEFLRRRLLGNMPAKEPAKELVKRSFR